MSTNNRFSHITHFNLSIIKLWSCRLSAIQFPVQVVAKAKVLQWALNTVWSCGFNYSWKDSQSCCYKQWINTFLFLTPNSREFTGFCNIISATKSNNPMIMINEQGSSLSKCITQFRHLWVVSRHAWEAGSLGFIIYSQVVFMTWWVKCTSKSD